jgi:putative aldouronate transport system substrate-binding protein
MKRNIFRQALAVGLSMLMVSSFTACQNEVEINLDGGDPNAQVDKITVMADTVMTPENGLGDVCAQYEKNTGIKLEIEKPDHAKYYEKVTLSFASENPANIIEMGSTYYPEMANSGALWDMTEAWDTSTSNCKKITDEDYVDALKIDGHLYGFPMAKGNGTITYVRGDWLEEAGLDAPKNYDEFLTMLRAFKARGNGAIPITAAGLINSETPYDIYLREFYQDAVPDFYKDESGKYVDGFAEEPMKQAMQRMRDAYAEGLIDAEIVTNGTSTCRDKLGSGLVGAFNYWAGMWAPKLERTLSEPGAYLTAIPPIEETTYIERVPTALAMSVYTENKAAVFEKFLMYSHDGGEGQLLFTHGVEGEHYVINDDGSYEALGYLEDPTTPVEKAFFAPELNYTSWEDPFVQDERVTKSLETFQNNRVFATVPIVTDAISENLSDLMVVKQQVLAQAVTGKWTVDEAMEYYKTKGAYYVNAILDDLNNGTDAE